MSFWNNVEKELEYLVKSKKELSAESGMNLQTLHKAIERNSVVSAENAVKIAKVLNVSVEFLVTGNDTAFSKKGIDYSKYKKYSELIEKIDRLSDKSKTALENIIDVMEKT